MVLMQIQSWEAFQVRIVEGPEECVYFESNVIRNSSFTRTEIESVFVGPYKINNVFLFLILIKTLKGHLSICLLNNSFDQYSYCFLFDDWSFEKLEHGLSIFNILFVVLKQIHKSIFIFWCSIVLISFIFFTYEFLKIFVLPQSWIILQLGYDSIIVFVQWIKLDQRIF